MTYASDSGQAAFGDHAANPWLAEIKAEAARRQTLRDVSALNEDQLLDEAALGIAERRAARDDLAGALEWEEIAGYTRTRVVPERPDGGELRADDSETPATGRTGRD
ncbi:MULTISPECIES: hypothetical protein [Streptomyces]|uniref:hypothetical protein n=1 Tax=Streptomyces TaxID=1883 RepID=UPI000DFB183C|nr:MULTISPECIES: hypothetical protein [Streptomyces]MBT3078365.1 hypothetical protein [Streptomyces sp. COG21]MBT3087685.1 hypothetical protein [Streptomyces sp. CYG21]MBT3099393.1 hypothetical protein [Streptomyces sp. CBG30]MBT3104009.1 hypothetical protein [Streptomyces sp. COG19]MBT3113415.1 hypothetical protein [Streptomyces sp. CYG20]